MVLGAHTLGCLQAVFLMEAHVSQFPKRQTQAGLGQRSPFCTARGAGQVRRVVNASANSYQIDQPWDFEPQGPSSSIGASFITIVPYVGKIIMEGNLAKNSTTMQVFGSGI